MFCFYALMAGATPSSLPSPTSAITSLLLVAGPPTSHGYPCYLRLAHLPWVSFNGGSRLVPINCQPSLGVGTGRNGLTGDGIMMGYVGTIHNKGWDLIWLLLGEAGSTIYRARNEWLVVRHKIASSWHLPYGGT